MCREFPSWSLRFEIAITIRKSNDPIGVRDVQKLRVVAGRIKSDPERFVKIALCKGFSHIRFPIAVSIAEHLDLIGQMLYNEKVAVRWGKQESRIAKSSRVQFNFESGRSFGLRVRWTGHNPRPINCASIRTRWRQILDCDFARDAGRIARPIAHRLFAGEDRALFCGPGDCVGDDENAREKDYAQN